MDTHDQKLLTVNTTFNRMNFYSNKLEFPMSFNFLKGLNYWVLITELSCFGKHKNHSGVTQHDHY